MFRIDELGDRSNLTADAAKLWLSGEASISGLGGLVDTSLATTGLATLLEDNKPGCDFFTSGDLDVIAAMTAAQGDAFL